MAEPAFSKESRRQIESMQQQLLQVASQRDSAYMQVASIQEQCQQYAASLSNLQLVLEHFQKGKLETGSNVCCTLKRSVGLLVASLEFVLIINTIHHHVSVKEVYVTFI